MKKFFAESAAIAAAFVAVVVIVGPTASANTLAFKVAMALYTGSF